MPLLRSRPWQRLSVRVAAGFVAVTLLGIGLVGLLIYERQKHILQETLAVDDATGAGLTRIGLTSVDAADQEILESLVKGSGAAMR